MEQTEGAPPPPTKDGNESLPKNQGGQTSVSEKQMTADEKCSEEGVQDELLRQEASGWPPRIDLAFSSPVFGSSNVIRGGGVKGSRPRKKSKGQATHNMLPYPVPLDVSPFSSPTSNWSNIQSPYISHEMSHAGYSPSLYIPFIEHLTTNSDWRKKEKKRASSSFDSTAELILGESKKTYPSTAADPTPGHSLDDTRGTELNATAGPSTLQSLQEDKDLDCAAFYDREKGVELSGSKVGGYDKPPRKEVSSLCSTSASTFSSPVFWSSSAYSLSLPSLKHLQESRTRVKLKGQATHNILPYPVSSIPEPTLISPKMEKKMRASISFDSTNELMLTDSKKTYPTAADPTPGHSQDDTRGTELNATAGLSTFQPSTKEDKDSDSAACYDREKGVELSGSTVGGHGKPPRKEVSSLRRRFASTFQGSRTREKLTGQGTHNILPYQGQLDASPFSTPASNWNNVQSPCIASDKGKHARYSPSLYIPFHSSSFDSTDKFGLILGERKKTFLSTTADPTPGHNQDDTSGTELYATGGPSTFQLSAKEDNDSDSATFYDRKKLELFGSTVGVHDKPPRTIINSRPRLRPWTNDCVQDLEVSSRGEKQKEQATHNILPDPGLLSASLPTSTRKYSQSAIIPSGGRLPPGYFPPHYPPSYDNPPTSSQSILHLPVLVHHSFSLQYAKRIPKMTDDTDSSDSDCDTSECSKIKSAVKHKRKSKKHSSRRRNRSKKSFPGVASTVDSSDYTLDKPSPGPLRETVMKTLSTAADAIPGNSQDDTRETELHATAGPVTNTQLPLKTIRPSRSLPDMLLKRSEAFTPDITVGDNDETYWFLCSCPGLYQCSVTGLVFHMVGVGNVVYRIVSWDRRLLAQHHKKPAGPLFDIKCLQQSVCRLHLPHCEIPSTAGGPFLSVAHLNDEGIEFIPPQKITETHVIINISGFSAFGNVKDEDSPPEPVRALVLLFYRPADDQNLTSFLNVLMLPRNAVLRDVRRTRKKLVGDELYIETSSHCKLLPKKEYTLSTCPEDDSVLVQPKDAEFDEESYDNYIPSFQVTLKTVILNMKVLLRDTNSSHIVWEREVCLPSDGLKRLCVQGSSDKILKDIRSSFIEGISGPVLKSLLDKLFEKKVLTDSERESADDKCNREDKARFVFDTVRRKGEAASSEMIQFLCEVDPFLCKHLGLIVT